MALENAWLDEETFPIISGQPPVVRALLLMMAVKHRPTYFHMCQVASYTEMLARKLQLKPAEADQASLAALLHDIGKAGVGDDVLTKPGRLDDLEMQMMALHPEWGAQILFRTGEFDGIYEAVRAHHEWFNGLGYPNRLAGREIPLFARMIAIADAFDTMTGPRPYRKSISVDAGLRELERCAGTQFDPELVPAFTEAVREACKAGVSWTQRRMLRSGTYHDQAEPLALRLGRTSI